MIPLPQLWLPIVVSAVIVFVASSILHMVLPYHRSDYKRVPEEEKVLGAMRTGNIQPGFYSFPYCPDMKQMNAPETIEKFKTGPVGLMIVRRSGRPNMGKLLALWFLYTLVIGVFAGYIACHTLPAGTHYLTVFRVVGTAAFMAYSFAHFSNFIWKGEPGSLTAKQVIDGLIYGLLTAGTFGWLWPR